MADLDRFRALQQDASDRRYPQDNSKLRPAHADYARSLLNRVKAQEGVIMAALRAKQSEDWRETSQFAKDHPFEQVLTGFAVVEDYMNRKQLLHGGGQLVELIDGKRRHVLAQACAALYTHMKSFLNAGVEIRPLDADDFAESLEQVTPDAKAIVDFFS